MSYEEDNENAAHYHIPYCANHEGNTILTFLLIISIQGSVIANTRIMIAIQSKYKIFGCIIDNNCHAIFDL